MLSLQLLDALLQPIDPGLPLSGLTCKGIALLLGYCLLRLLPFLHGRWRGKVRRHLA